VALCDRDGDLEREQRRERRQPVEFLAARLRRALPAREPHRPVVTETEDRVVGPRGLDPTERQVGPLPKLLDHQPVHERFVDLELVGMHRGHGRTSPTGTRAAGRGVVGRLTERLSPPGR
jgi:hypothetical protein